MRERGEREERRNQPTEEGTNRRTLGGQEESRSPRGVTGKDAQKGRARRGGPLRVPRGQEPVPLAPSALAAAARRARSELQAASAPASAGAASLAELVVAVALVVEPPA